MIPKGLGDTFYTPLGMLPNPLGRYLNTPITGIGRSDEVYLHRMKALIGSNEGFNWYESALQSVTDFIEFLRKSKKLLPFSRSWGSNPDK